MPPRSALFYPAKCCLVYFTVAELWSWKRKALAFFYDPGGKNRRALRTRFGDVGGVRLVLKTFTGPYSLFRLPIRCNDDLAVKHISDFWSGVHMPGFNFVWGEYRFLQARRFSINVYALNFAC